MTEELRKRIEGLWRETEDVSEEERYQRFCLEILGTSVMTAQLTASHMEPYMGVDEAVDIASEWVNG